MKQLDLTDICLFGLINASAQNAVGWGKSRGNLGLRTPGIRDRNEHIGRHIKGLVRYDFDIDHNTKDTKKSQLLSYFAYFDRFVKF